MSLCSIPRIRGFLGAVSGQEGDLAMSALETAQRGSGRGALEASCTNSMIYHSIIHLQCSYMNLIYNSVFSCYMPLFFEAAKTKVPEVRGFKV